VPDDPLEHIIWDIGRTYYAYIGLLEQLLAETGLDRHIRPGMGSILFALFEEDGRSIKEIAARVRLSGSTLTGLLTRMEHGGLIERRRDEGDRRLVRVRLTPLGRSLRPRCHAVVQALDEIIREGMGDQGARDAKRLLLRLTEVLRTEEAQRLRSRATGTRRGK
jgi:DNA-binding MarR family transcriptional regulator